MENKKKHLFLIGNPLLDMSIETSDNSLIDKYGLQLGQASLATEKEMPLYQEIWKTEGV